MSDIPESLRPLLKKPAAILGEGISGRAVSETLSFAGFSSVVYDEHGHNRSFGFEEAARHDLLIYSPGFSQTHPWLLTARRARIRCLSELDLGALLWTGSSIAVTGTNGKSTLTEFLSFAAKRSGRDAVACGNVGIPFTTLHRTVSKGAFLAVVEVSSFQSEDLRHFTPEGVLWTNFDEDHLDRHGDLETYFRAKYKLIERMMPQGVLVVGESVVTAAQTFGIALPEQTIVATRNEALDTVPRGSAFDSWPQHENWALLVKYWQASGLCMQHLIEAAQFFRIPSHRLYRVCENKGIEFWNDSKGTNFHAVKAALKQFHLPVRWIGGGKWKGGNISSFAREIAPMIESAHLIGETSRELLQHFEALGKPAMLHSTLPEAVKAAAKDASSPSVILLSPGFSSFDQFRDYAERGRVFEQCAIALSRHN